MAMQVNWYSKAMTAFGALALYAGAFAWGVSSTQGGGRPPQQTELASRPHRLPAPRDYRLGVPRPSVWPPGYQLPLQGPRQQPRPPANVPGRLPGPLRSHAVPESPEAARARRARQQSYARQIEARRDALYRYYFGRRDQVRQGR